MKKRKKIRRSRLTFVLSSVLAVMILFCWGVIFTIRSMFGLSSAKSGDHPEASAQKETESAASGSSSFRFTGVGDNLLHDPIFVYYEQDTGTRDFLPLYEYTLPYFEDSDIAYINFETVCAGDEYGLSGYPNFNGPLEMMDALASAGFNWFSTSSNHSLDTGVAGLSTEMEYIESNYPHILYTGTHLSQEDAGVPVVMEVNGIKVGLAGFTYGMNGYVLPEGYEWMIDVFVDENGNLDYAAMDAILDPLMEVSDVQIVSMHWGQEYQFEPNEVQTAAAAYLNEKGVEVIIGTHPHVIQPAEIYHGDVQDTLIYYSLGNFISAQNHNYTMVGGMARFDLNYDFGTGQTTFENVQFIPTVTYISPDLRTYRTLTISEYSDEWADSQYVNAVEGEDISVAYVQQLVASVLGKPAGIEVVYE